MEVYRKSGEKTVNLWSPEYSFINARIEPYGNKVFNFSESDYFRWNAGEVYVRRQLSWARHCKLPYNLM